MPSDTQSKNFELTIRRTLEASPERVFDAWTDPKQLMQWFRPTAEHKPLLMDVDPRVGGKYRFRVQCGTDKPHGTVGVFQIVDRPHKLVFTWKWEEPMGAYPGELNETLVTIEFKDLGGKTELTLTHQRFPAQKGIDMHSQGWNACLDSLNRFVAK